MRKKLRVALQRGIPKDIYTLINQYTDAKDIWDNVKMILEGSELTKDDRNHIIRLNLNASVNPKRRDHSCLLAYLKQHEVHAMKQNDDERTSSNARNKATVQDDRVVVQDVHDRYNVNNQGRPFQRNNARGNGVARNVGGQNRVGNMNPGQAKPIMCYNCKESTHSTEYNNDRKRLRPQFQKPLSALTVYPPNTPVKLVPRVLPTKSQVKINLYVLSHQHFLREFDKLAKENHPNRCVQKGERGVQTTLFKEVKVMEEIFDQILMSGIMNVVGQACARNYLEYQHLQESFDNKKSQASQEAPDFNSFFKIKNLEHQIQEKDNNEAFKSRIENIEDLKAQLEGNLKVATRSSVKTKVLAPADLETKGKLSDNRSKTRQARFATQGKLTDNSLNKTKQFLKSMGNLFANVGYNGDPRKKFSSGKLNLWTPTQIGDPKFQTLQIRLFSNAGGTDHPLVSGLRLFKTRFRGMNGLGPEPIMMTPGQLISGLAPSPVPATTYIPPTDKDLEILFQPMFNEYFDQSTDGEPVPTATVVNAPIVSTNTSVSTTIAQDAPSTSHSLSSSQVHPPVFPQGVAAGPTIEDTSITQADLHPSVNPVAGEPSSAQSTSRDVSLAEPNQVNQPPDHLRKWTKDHPLDNIVGNPSRPVSTRKQLASEPLW
ncbi:hypothetical protein Tco_0868704 [Tanacetum coccineum]